MISRHSFLYWYVYFFREFYQIARRYRDRSVPGACVYGLRYGYDGAQIARLIRRIENESLATD